MSRIIDFHSHVLPGIDDGSKNLEQSLEMLRRSAQQGVDQMIATPHFYAHHDDPERFLRRRVEAELRLREAMAGQEGLPELGIGAEVYYFNGIADSEALLELTINKKRYILLEMPMSSWTDRMYREIEGIWIKQGLMPIVAHLDRYVTPFHAWDILERLEDLPVLIQVNASFFIDSNTRRLALKMLKKGKIHLLGSDCHDLSDRAPNLGEALAIIQKKLGQDHINRINYYEDEVLFAD